MYIKPQVLVFQEFKQTPIARDTSLRAWIVGQNAEIHERGEEILLQNGSSLPILYDGEDITIAYPNKNAGSVIDKNSVRVYADDAFIRYLEVPAPAVTQEDPLTMDKIHAYAYIGSDDQLLFNKFYLKEIGTAHARSAELGLRDVQIGDVVRISGYVSNFAGANECSNKVFETEVADFVVGVAASEVEKAVRRTTLGGCAAPSISPAITGATFAAYNGKLGSEEYKLYITSDKKYKVESISGTDSYPYDYADIQETTVNETESYVLPIGYGSTKLTVAKTALEFPEAAQSPAEYTITVANGTFTAESSDVSRYTAFDDGIHIGPANVLTLSSVGGGYSPLETGMTSQKYVITVTGKHRNLGCKNVELRIISESGLDNQYNVQALYTQNSGEFAFNVTGDGSVVATFDETGFDAIEVGHSWVFVLTGSYTAAAMTVDPTSIYTGDIDDTYVVTCIDGGVIGSADTAPRIAYRTVSGSDYKSDITVTNDETVIITKLGVKFSFANGQLALNESYTFNVKSSQNAAVCGLKLKDALPYQFLSDIPANPISPTQTELNNRVVLNVQLGVKGGADITENATITSSQVTIPYNCVIHDDRFVTSGGGYIDLKVLSGKISVAYREWVIDGVEKISFCANMEELDKIPGPLSPENPLKYAVYKALSNSNGTSVAYTNVQEDTEDGWLRAFATATGNRDVYTVVPITQNLTYLNLARDLVQQDSNEETCAWKNAYFNLTAPNVLCVVSKATSLNGNDVSGYVKADGHLVIKSLYTNDKINADLSKVRAGDELRVYSGISYSSYIINSVVGNDVEVLNAPTFTNTTAYPIEIWHTCTKDEQIDYITDKARSFNSRRINFVWPDIVYENEVALPGTFLCAALAGLSSGVLPNQGLTRVSVAGFDDLSRSYEYFNGTQLNALAAEGVWIVTENQEGTIHTRHAITTAIDSLLYSEEMVTRNIDHISFAIRDLLDPYIGVTNITEDTIKRINSDLYVFLTKISASNYSAQGPQLTSFEIIDISQDPLLLDRINVIVSGVVPKATNVIEFHIQAS